MIDGFRKGIREYSLLTRRTFLFTLLIFLLSLVLMFSNILLGLCDVYLARNENPYSDYFRLHLNFDYLESVFGTPEGYATKHQMRVGNWGKIKKVHEYFLNITDYTVELSCTSSADTMSAYIPTKRADWDTPDFTLYGVQMCMELTNFAKGNLTLVDGEYITERHANSLVCLISDTVAEINQVEVGDTFPIKLRVDVVERESIYETFPFTIIGIYHDNLFTNENTIHTIEEHPDNFIYIPCQFLIDYHEDYSVDGEPTSLSAYNYQIKLDNQLLVDEITETMNAAHMMGDYPGTFIRVRDIFAAENEGIHALMDGLRILQVLFLASALVLEILYVITTIRTRRREIGIHLGFGTPIRDISALLSGELFCSVFWGYGFAALCAYFFARPLALRIMNAAAASTSMAAVQNTTGDMLASAAMETNILENVTDTAFVLSSMEQAAVWIVAIFALGMAVTFLRLRTIKPMNLLTNREENL